MGGNRMKKFLEALEEASRNYKGEVPDNTHAEATYSDLMYEYRQMVGKRALYKCKSTRESKVVTVEKAMKYFVLLSYNYYGMDYNGKVFTTVNYSSLLCGEDVIGDVQ
jgi:hypothetical protein